MAELVMFQYYNIMLVDYSCRLEKQLQLMNNSIILYFRYNA